MKGGPAPGSKLTCANTFKPDLLTALLYRAPQALSYRWLQNGQTLQGETSANLTAHSVADYSCLVTGQNTAGSATQSSGVEAIFKLGHLRRNLNQGTAKLTVVLPGAGGLKLKGKKVIKQRLAAATQGTRALARKVKGGRVKLLIRAKGKARRRLDRTGKVKVKVKIDYRLPACRLSSGGSGPRSSRPRTRRRESPSAG